MGQPACLPTPRTPTAARAARRAAASLLGLMLAGRAPSAGAAGPIVAPPAEATSPEGEATLSSGVIQRGNLLGNIFGLRSALGTLGVSLDITETSEVFANATGGIYRNAAYDGLTTATLEIDSGRAFGYAGGTIHVSALDYHGRNFSADTLLNLQTTSGIEADRGARLWEFWYDQKFLDGNADIKLGEQSIDQDFLISSNGLLFVNTMFGWPLVPSYDLPGGGPAYPLATPGVRIRAQASPNLTVLAGVFNGSPTHGDCTGDPQRCNPSGTSFPLDGRQLILGELQYAFPANGDLVRPGGGSVLAGSYKLGFWLDTERFADQRVDPAGISLANPAAGPAASHRADWSVYGVVDQTVWQRADGSQPLNVFARLMGAPADRNLISFALNAGLVLHQPLPHRSTDSLGLAVSYGKISPATRGLDRDLQALQGGFARSDETVIEATYQYVPFAWWQIQPDFQYVFNPGAGIANPLDPTHKLHNEAVFGLRTTIVF